MFLFFFTDTATTEIYTLSLHDALPIWVRGDRNRFHLLRLRETSSRSFLEISTRYAAGAASSVFKSWGIRSSCDRSEEHTSELQSHVNLVCRLLLEKKKKKKIKIIHV